MRRCAYRPFARWMPTKSGAFGSSAWPPRASASSPRAVTSVQWPASIASVPRQSGTYQRKWGRATSSASAAYASTSAAASSVRPSSIRSTTRQLRAWSIASRSPARSAAASISVAVASRSSACSGAQIATRWAFSAAASAAASLEACARSTARSPSSRERPQSA